MHIYTFLMKTFKEHHSRSDDIRHFNCFCYWSYFPWRLSRNRVCNSYTTTFLKFLEWTKGLWPSKLKDINIASALGFFCNCKYWAYPVVWYSMRNFAIFLTIGLDFHGRINTFSDDINFLARFLAGSDFSKPIPEYQVPL